jgi:hypothetical protein
MECSSAQTNSRNKIRTGLTGYPAPLGPALWYGPGASAANGKASRRYYRGGLLSITLVTARRGGRRAPGAPGARALPLSRSRASLLLRVPMIDPPI